MQTIGVDSERVSCDYIIQSVSDSVASSDLCCMNGNLPLTVPAADKLLKALGDLMFLSKNYFLKNYKINSGSIGLKTILFSLILLRFVVPVPKFVDSGLFSLSVLSVN